MSMNSHEYAALDHEDRTGETPPVEFCCPNCGALWTVPTRWGELPDDPHVQQCELCGEAGEER